jgi:chemotaxis protein methyltransferase CheR
VIARPRQPDPFGTADTKGSSIVELQRLNSKQFDRFRKLVYEVSGIRIDEKKVTLLSNRIRRRLKARSLSDFDVYYRYVTSREGSGEIECLIDAVTTNETFFFRTQKHFDWLVQKLIPERIERHEAERRTPGLRIWSAGCSNGAEPYSIAICLHENAYRLDGWSLRVLATDISEEVLREAREGCYKSRVLQDVSETRLRRHFQQQTEGDRWQIRPAIKSFVEFRTHNLMRPPPESSFDCIWIRNVLIYFDQESKRIVIQNLLKALARGGYLVVGPSEGVYGMLNDLKKIAPTIYQKT